MHEIEDAADPKGYYRALGLRPDASMAAIRQAWRELARVHHPDMGGDERHFRHLCEAYETLSDPRRRMAYDRAAVRQDPPMGDEPQPQAAPPSPPRPPRRRRGRVALVTSVLGLLVGIGAGGLWLVSQLEALDPLRRLVDVLGDPLVAPSATAEKPAMRRLPAAEAPRDAAALAAERRPAAGDVSSRRVLYEATLRFEPGRWRLDELDPVQFRALFDGLRTALEPVAGERWWVEVQASSPRAVGGGRAAVNDWELALLRLAAVLEEFARQRLPAERLGVGFRAGASAELGELGVVRVRLYCCRGGAAVRPSSNVQTLTGSSTPRSR